MATATPHRSVARKNALKDIPKAEAQEIVLAEIAAGAKVEDACAKAGRTRETYRDWMKNDAAFKAELQALRAAKAEQGDVKRPVPDFPEFCRDYLGEPLFPHQMRAWRVITGQHPGDIHTSMQYEPGDNGRIILNFPPNHAKTTTFSINYVTWLIHKNPGISIALISKSQGYAKKILSGVKARLTSKTYREMHLAFAPDGGWRDPDQSWTQTMIYVQGKYDGETEKDPTVEAVGLGGQIYGGRFDVIICDDVVDNENAHRYEDQTDWLMTILDSRLPPDGGKMLVLGTRLAPNDLYGNLRKLTDEDEEQFFTYFSQPAVLDYDVDGDWLCLWPWQLAHESAEDAERRCITCYAPEGGCDHDTVVWMKPRWTKARLAKKRFPLGERRWALVWQQQQIPDDATFNQKAVEASINRQRKPGVMTGAMGQRQTGMNGLYVVGGLDPATVGSTAMMIVGLDRFTQKRWVLDGFNQPGTSPQLLRDTVKRLTDAYRVNEWVIERNAFQRFLSQDPDLRAFLQSRGCRLSEHYTGSNKLDPDFGVMSMAPLFESAGTPPENGGGGMWKKDFEHSLIELPDDRTSAVVSALVSQLITWEPSGLASGTKTDLVMALWFCDIACKRILGTGRKIKTHLDNPFASRARLRERTVVNIQDYLQAAADAAGGAG